MRNTLLSFIFLFKLTSLQSQNCILKDRNLSLSDLIANEEKCDTFFLIKCCLNYQYSKKLDWSLSYFIKNTIIRGKSEESKNTARLERFTSLFYANKLILKDTAIKEIAVLIVNGIFIYDNYMNNEYCYSEKEKKTLIKLNLKKSVKYNRHIKLYYGIIKAYIFDYEQKGESVAKINYTKALVLNKIQWEIPYHVSSPKLSRTCSP